MLTAAVDARMADVSIFSPASPQAGWIVEIPKPDLRAARRQIRELIGSACHEDQSRRLDASERVPGSKAAELP